MSQLLSIKRNKGATKKKKTVGRGNGSGHGTYSTRGGNGQTARTGGNIRPGFIGGQTPIYRKMPKLGGFKNINRIEYQAINFNQIELNFKEGELVNPSSLYEKGLIRNKTGLVKLLGTGELTKKLSITTHAISQKAEEKLSKSQSKFEAINHKKETTLVNKKEKK